MNQPNQTGPNSVAPGVALLVVGILSLLCSGGVGFSFYQAYSGMTNPETQAQFRAEFEEKMKARRDSLPAERQAEFDRQMQDMGSIWDASVRLIFYAVAFSVLGLVLSGVMILGGFGLMKGSKMLGLLGGAAALIPQWCCIVGLPVGIWAIVVSLKLGKTPSNPPANPSTFN